MDYFYVAIADDYGVLGCWRNESDAKEAVLWHFKYHKVELISEESCDNLTWNSTAENVTVFTGKKEQRYNGEVYYRNFIGQVDKRFVQDTMRLHGGS